MGHQEKVYMHVVKGHRNQLHFGHVKYQRVYRRKAVVVKPMR